MWMIRLDDLKPIIKVNTPGKLKFCLGYFDSPVFITDTHIQFPDLSVLYKVNNLSIRTHNQQ